jgi:hypothetical protein
MVLPVLAVSLPRLSIVRDWLQVWRPEALSPQITRFRIMRARLTPSDTCGLEPWCR